MKQRLAQLISQTDLQVTEQQLDQLVGYVELLNKWNKAYNLTSVRDPNEMLVKHIMDSIVVSEYLKGDHYIDVGTDLVYRAFLWQLCVQRNLLLCSIA